MGGGGAGPYAGGVIGQARRGGRVPAAGQRRASVLRASRRDAQKKTAHAAEQDREDVAAEREAWLEAQPHLDPTRLVFIDEERKRVEQGKSVSARVDLGGRRIIKKTRITIYKVTR